jgi:hypothetical protein
MNDWWKAWHITMMKFDRTFIMCLFILCVFLFISFKYLKCSLNFLSWYLVLFLSMLSWTKSIQSMASMKTLLFLFVNLIINNKIKVCFLLIVVLLGIVILYVVNLLPLTNVVKFGMFKNWWLQDGVDGLLQKIRRNHQGWWTFKKFIP